MISVDTTSTERRTRAFLDAIKSVTKQPVRTLVNTHHHPDHTQVLETVLRPLGARIIVPGHGPVCGPEVIDDMLAYLRFVQDLARQAKTAGLAPLDAARQAGLGEFKDLLDAERIVGNLHRACLELDGAERGAPADVPRALTDMVTCNGGQPLTCHA